MVSFREYLKTLEQKETGTVNESVNTETLQQSGVSYIISKTIALSSQIHIWHLLAKSGQKHTVLGDFYEALQDEVDKLAEKFLAIGGTLDNFDYSLYTEYIDESIVLTVKNYRDEISNTIANVKLDSNLESILDSLTDLQEAIDNFSYQFKLD